MLIDEHKDLHKRVSILEDDTRMIKKSNVPHREKIMKQSGDVGCKKYKEIRFVRMMCLMMR